MDAGWLSNEARHIHDLFSGIFYSLVLTMLLFGVVLNYFRMPMGQVPEFIQLVGRAVIAAFLLVSIPEIMNIAADLTDQFSAQIGGMNNFKLVVHRLGEKVGELSWSWVSIKDSVLLLISYISFFLLYVTVFIADTLFMFTWMLLYVFSSILVAAFVLPGTASATRGYFQSLIEVCLWKIVWTVLAVLLWSFALSKINDPQYGIDFLTAILLNLMLAFSVVVTPMIVRGLLNGGLHSVSASLGGVILNAASLTPQGIMKAAKWTASRPIVEYKREKKIIQSELGENAKEADL